MLPATPKGMTMTKDTVHHPRTLVNTPTPQLHHTGPLRAGRSGTGPGAVDVAERAGRGSAADTEGFGLGARSRSTTATLW